MDWIREANTYIEITQKAKLLKTFTAFSTYIMVNIEFIFININMENTFFQQFPKQPHTYTDYPISNRAPRGTFS